jgi:predicted peptidase
MLSLLSLVLSTTLLAGDQMATRTTKAARDEAGQINKKTFIQNGMDYPYWLYVPKGAKKDAPLILFLHGSGEREGGAKGPQEVGIGPAIAKQKDFPFYVIIPQFSKQGSWVANGDDAKRAMAILDEVVKEQSIDTKRLYLTGLSMGGCGVWENAVAYPDKWAAIAPVCGYHTEKGNFYSGLGEGKLESIKNLPCWCFHGDKDKAVPVNESRAAMKILWSAGAHPNYTEYPGVSHNCWDLTYTNPELYRWFLSNVKK